MESTVDYRNMESAQEEFSLLGKSHGDDGAIEASPGLNRGYVNIEQNYYGWGGLTRCSGIWRN